MNNNIFIFIVMKLIRNKIKIITNQVNIYIYFEIDYYFIFTILQRLQIYLKYFIINDD